LRLMFSPVPAIRFRFPSLLPFPIFLFAFSAPLWFIPTLPQKYLSSHPQDLRKQVLNRAAIQALGNRIAGSAQTTVARKSLFRRFFFGHRQDFFQNLFVPNRIFSEENRKSDSL